MPFIKIPDILANDYNFTPLDRTWFEVEFVSLPSETIRFAKRTDHTGILIQINKAEFYDANT